MTTAVQASRSAARLRAWEITSRVLGALVLLIATLVLVGWAVGSDMLIAALPGLPAMKVNTALGFVATGAWLLVTCHGAGCPNPIRSGACFALGTAVGLLGLVTLVEYIFGGDFGIDQFLFSAAPPQPNVRFPARMAPATALNFFVLGGAMLLVRRQTSRTVTLAQTAALLTLVTSFATFVGYVYGVKHFPFAVPFAPMALHTALSFVFAGLGFLLVTANGGWMSDAVADTPGGSLLRRLVPVTLVVATCIGWVRLKGEQLGWYEAALGTSLLVVALVLVYSIALWANSRRLTRADVERNRAQEAIGAASEQRRLAMEAAALGAWDYRFDSGRVFWDERCRSMWGIMDGEQIDYDAVINRIHAADRARVDEAVRAALAGANGGAYHQQFRAVWPDGSEHWIDSHGQVYFEGEGEQRRAVRFIGANREITAERRAADALRYSEAERRAIIEHSPLGVYLVDSNLRIQHVNPRARPAFGESEPMGRDIPTLAHEIWPADTAEAIVSHFRRVLETGEPFKQSGFSEERRDRGRREFYDWELYRIRLPDGQHGVACYFMDVSEHVLAQQQIRESAERFRFLAESMPQKIFTATPNGEVDYFNQQWTEFTGLTFEQIRDWGWLQFIHPDDVEENIRRWKHSVETGEPFYLEHRFRRADGEYRWHVSRAHAMRDEQGNVVMWIGSNTDIEEVRQAKEQAERASRTKDEFLAALSHELRTPLTPVLMTAAILRDDTRLPLDARDQLAMMKHNIELEARLIDDLLDLTRIAHGKLALRVEPCDAHSILALAAEMVRSEARTKRLALEIDLCAQHTHVMGDAARLQQVFWNLLKNAVKFTPENGRVALRSRDEEGKLIVEVSDTGVGITPESFARIFLPFEQAIEVQQDRRFGGLGLGLSISKAILDLHGGAIEVESGGTGQGASFRVHLTLTDAPVAKSIETGTAGSVDLTARPRGVEVSQRPLRVLLVEDHEATIQVLRRLLTRAGHHVTTAMTVAGAMQAAEDGSFDVVISDLGLPDGTGFELMQSLRDSYRLRGIALSGYGMDDDLRRSREAGFAAHLIKPVDFAQLQQAVTELVEK